MQEKEAVCHSSTGARGGGGGVGLGGNKNVTYFIVRKSQNWMADSQVAATAFTSCGSHAPPDKLCNIPADSFDCT